jgi:spore coat protein A
MSRVPALIMIVFFSGFFLQGCAQSTPRKTVASAAAAGNGDAHSKRQPAAVFQKFVDELPIPQRITFSGAGPFDLTMTESQFGQKIHRDLPETQVWGYNGSTPGPIIEVERGQKLTVHWKNELPTKHLFPLPKNADVITPDVRTVTHLHGAVVTQTSITDKFHDNDGWPDAWIVPGEEQISEYENNQSARTLWYHDHAMGSTGRNVAAGLLGLYEIHDDYERSLNLPSGPYEIPLMIGTAGKNADGSLFYTDDIDNEFYGNAISINGKLWPYVNVEPRKYRFRMINVSNARSYGLKLIDYSDNSSGPAFNQIGTDSGFLEETAVIADPSDPNAIRLQLAPAERADVIIDFSKYAGKTFTLQNNQRDPGEGEIPLPDLMQFRVATTLSAPDTSSLPMKMAKIPKLKPSDAKETRLIVFGQMTMPDGNVMLQLNGLSWNDPIVEKPVLGTTEIWQLANTLTDVHPFHIHLVQFQILDRTLFDVDNYLKTGKINYLAPPVSPDPNELGWKDTVRVLPQMITRIILRFEPYAGYYVYHCHILEHEDMDMMRPFQIVAPAKLRFF